MKNKIILFLMLIGVVAGLFACSENFESSARKIKDKMTIKVLQTSSVDPDSDLPADYTLLCIDGVKYIKTKEGGISVKYQANENGDPSAEECD
jgi:ABC-type glycerol-3-phosphate transport system substrate-binding protein